MNIGSLVVSILALGRMGKRQHNRNMASFDAKTMVTPKKSEPNEFITWTVRLQRELPRDWKITRGIYHAYISYENKHIAECDLETKNWRTVNPQVTKFLVDIGQKAYLDVPDDSLGLMSTTIPPFPFSDPVVIEDKEQS